MIEIITDNRMSRNQSRYDLVFFRWNGATYRFAELPEEIQHMADKVYPVTPEARQHGQFCPISPKESPGDKSGN